MAFGNSEGKGGSSNWKSKGMGVLTIGILRSRGVSGGERQECECTKELMTLLMIAESKIQDKHRSIMHVFAFIYRNLIKSGLYIGLQSPLS